MENNDNESETPNVIIDNGSSYIRCGLNGEEGPRVVIRSRIGYRKIILALNLMIELFISEKILSLEKVF